MTSHPSLDNYILVVDDDIVSSQLLGKALSMANYNVRIENGATAALHAIKKSKPDLILLDVIMPEIDGYELCRLLKDAPESRDIPIIFITGLSNHEEINKGFAAGAVDFITKPFDINEVKSRVKTHLTLRAAKESLRHKNTQLKQIIKEQTISISLAHKVLGLINSCPPRYIALDNNETLFVNIFSQPCHEEGGDHFLIRTLPQTTHRPKRTVISLKDQSGHSVNCILRSITTDLIHNSILHNTPNLSLEEGLGVLNNTLLHSTLFETDDFLTGITAELDHSDLTLRFTSAGHPPFVHIRNGVVRSLPTKGGSGINLPLGFQEDASFSGDSVQLHEGDKLIFYTDGLPDMPLLQTGTTLDNHKLISIVQKCLSDTPNANVSAIMDAFLWQVRHIATPNDPDQTHFSDDITVLGLEIEGHCPKNEILLTNITDIDQQISECVAPILHQCATQGVNINSSAMELAVSELLLNAWKHGSLCNPDTTIRLRWWFSNDLNIEVTDQGNGFTDNDRKNPRLLSNLTKANGRGIFLINKFSDSARWLDGGRRAIISFKTTDFQWGQEIKQGSSDTFHPWSNVH